jgi:hypothetical protein
MTSEDTVWHISSAIIAAIFPPKTWCEEATNNDLDKALLSVLNSESLGETKISHIKGLNKLDEVLATLAKEAKLAYFTEGDK